MRKFPTIDLEKYLVDFNGYKYTISFVGNPSEDFCLETLCHLSKTYKNKFHIFASQKDFSKSVDKINQKNLLSEDDLDIYVNTHTEFKNDESESAKIYNSTRINLNINNKKKTSYNHQIFQIMVSGGFAITNEMEDLEKYFEISKQLETFNNNSDLVDKIDFYLKNSSITQKIAQSGKFEVIKNQKASIYLKKPSTKTVRNQNS